MCKKCQRINVQSCKKRIGVPPIVTSGEWAYTKANYYPFGLKFMNSLTAYRYGYQGEYAEDETDPSSGGGSKLKTNNFKLRLYDARIGRWLTTDPYRQYHSSYVALGNNPILNIDPDGGIGGPYENYDFDYGMSEDFMSTGFESADFGLFSSPLTKRGLEELTGLSGSSLEKEFENLFQKWGDKNYATFYVPESPNLGTNPITGEKIEVLPDGVSIGLTLGGRTYAAPNVSLWDAKASTSSSFPKVRPKQGSQLSNYKHILKAMSVKNVTKNALIIVTTADVTNIKFVKELGEKHGVSVRYVVAYKEGGLLGYYITMRERIWVGVPTGGGIPYKDIDVFSGPGAMNSQESVGISKY